MAALARDRRLSCGPRRADLLGDRICSGRGRNVHVAKAREMRLSLSDCTNAQHRQSEPANWIVNGN